MYPVFRVADFGLEGPAVDAPIDEFRRAILPRRSYDFQAYAEQRLLLPLRVLLRRQCRTALKVYGKPDGSIQQARAVD